jgi:hypothetical protein
VSVLHNRHLLDADPAVRLAGGDRISFLVPGDAQAVGSPNHDRPHHEPVR